MRIKNRIVAALLACAWLAACSGRGDSGIPASAQPSGEATGQVDSSFGGGIVTMGSMGPVAEVVALADGALIVGGGNSIPFPLGISNAYVAKIRADGEPDASFGNGGAFVEAGDGRRQSADRIRVLDANRIMVAQTRGRLCVRPAISCNAVEFRDVIARRLDARGVPDASYGTNGLATLPRSEGAIVIAADGRVTAFTAQLEESSFDRPLFTVASLDARGQRDAAFEARALAALNSCSTALQEPFLIGWAAAATSADRYVVAFRPSVGADMIVVSRLNADGTIDPTFGTSGCQMVRPAAGEVLPLPSRLIVRDDGSIVVALVQPPNATLQLAPAFVMVDAAGKQASLIHPAIALAWIGDIAAQPNGKLLAAGLANLAARSDARVLRTSASAATLDASFGMAGAGGASLTTALGEMTVQKVLLLPDGRIVVGGFAAATGTGMLMRLR